MSFQCELSFLRKKRQLMRFDRYKHLRHLQGVTIPKLHASGHMWKMFYAIVLEFCDGGAPNPSFSADSDGMIIALKRLHDEHVLHGDLAIRNLSKTAVEMYALSTLVCQQSE